MISASDLRCIRRAPTRKRTNKWGSTFLGVDIPHVLNTRVKLFLSQQIGFFRQIAPVDWFGIVVRAAKSDAGIRRRFSRGGAIRKN